MSSPPHPKKQRRISRACDFCHKRSIRCKPSQPSQSTQTPHPQCQNCVDFGLECTYQRPSKRRGTNRQQNHNQNHNHGISENELRDESQSQIYESSSVEQDVNHLLQSTSQRTDGSTERQFGFETAHENPIEDSRLEVDFSSEISEEHRALVLNNLAKIQDLVTVYFEIVYPIFPLFHRPTLHRAISTRAYLHTPSQFAMTMSICALASARARDGALYPQKWNASYLHSPAAEIFASAAIAVLPSDWGEMRGLDWMRTCAVLALVGIQVGNIRMMHHFLGRYHTIVAVDGLYDEKNWPGGIDMVEVEERRRLFWSIYTLEVYSSIVWGGIIRCRESQSRVLYPSEIDDEMFSSSGISNFPHSPTTSTTDQSTPFSKPAITDPSSWLHGWNFTTELYRILEHAMDEFHRRRPQNIGPFSPSDLFHQSAPPQSVVLERIILMHENLPSRFKETRGVVGETTADRYSFQAANITATLQLARMVLFTAEEATIEQKCAIARELLDDITNVPLFFLKAISSPLLHHLAGIGTILGSVIEGQLSLSEYLQVRTVLLGMADLLANLEVSLTRKAGASERLRTLLSRIDEYMSSQRVNETLPTNRDIGEQQQIQAPEVGFDNGMLDIDPQFSFQLPQELLDDWPWPLDLTQGFGNF